MLDRGQRRCASTTIIASDSDMISMCLGNTRSNSTDANFGYQLIKDMNIQSSIYVPGHVCLNLLKQTGFTDIKTIAFPNNFRRDSDNQNFIINPPVNYLIK